MIVRKISGALVGALVLVTMPAVALASNGTPVPEASSTLLFAIGAVGVLLGRTASMRRRKREKDKDKH